MLTIKNFDVLKGRTFIMPGKWSYNVIESFNYVSPVRGEHMYVVKLIIVTKKGLRDMRTFTDILKDELNGLC